MVDWRQISRRRWAVYLVLAFALADAAAIYYAHHRLSRSWTEQPGALTGGESLFAAAEAPSVIIRDVWPAAPAIAVTAAPARASAADRPAPVPAYRPLELAVAEADPVADIQLAARIPQRSGLRVARLQQPGKAARRFETAFATDMAAPPAMEASDQPAPLGAPPAQTGEMAQTGAASGYADIYAQLARDNGSAGAEMADGPAQDSAEPAVPQADPPPEAELPALAPDSANEIPPG